MNQNQTSDVEFFMLGKQTFPKQFLPSDMDTKCGCDEDDADHDLIFVSIMFLDVSSRPRPLLYITVQTKPLTEPAQTTL